MQRVCFSSSISSGTSIAVCWWDWGVGPCGISEKTLLNQTDINPWRHLRFTFEGHLPQPLWNPSLTALQAVRDSTSAWSRDEWGCLIPHPLSLVANVNTSVQLLIKSPLLLRSGGRRWRGDFIGTACFPVLWAQIGGRRGETLLGGETLLRIGLMCSCLRKIIIDINPSLTALQAVHSPGRNHKS